MKLKLVVSLMSAIGVLSLASSPALAAHQTKKHHYKHHKKAAVAAPHHVAYKDMGALPVRPPVVCPRMTMNDSILDAMRQSVGRAKPTEDCNKLIAFSGGINTDFAWGNRAQGYTTENVQRISLNDAYLNVNGNVNDWAKAFASLSFNNATSYNGRLGGLYSAAYSSSRSKINLEQGYITLGNFDVSPFFLDAGKEFQDYGRYEIHPIQRTLTQSLTESLETAVRVGFITNGFHGSVYTFDNPLVRTGEGHTTNIYGASLGYDMICEALGFDLGAGYMSNITGVNDIHSAISSFQAGGFTTFSGAPVVFTPNDASGSYGHTVGGIALYADVNSGPFSIGARYTKALQAFSPADLPTVYALGAPFSATPPTVGAKPWAADITAGYGFLAWNLKQNIYAGYQTSRDTESIPLPKSRWIVGYGVEVCNNANLGLQFGHDIAYTQVQQPGLQEEVESDSRNTSSNTINARIAVKFG